MVLIKINYPTRCEKVLGYHLSLPRSGLSVGDRYS